MISPQDVAPPTLHPIKRQWYAVLVGRDVGISTNKQWSTHAVEDFPGNVSMEFEALTLAVQYLNKNGYRHDQIHVYTSTTQYSLLNSYCERKSLSVPMELPYTLQTHFELGPCVYVDVYYWRTLETVYIELCNRNYAETDSSIRLSIREWTWLLAIAPKLQKGLRQMATSKIYISHCLGPGSETVATVKSPSRVVDIRLYRVKKTSHTAQTTQCVQLRAFELQQLVNMEALFAASYTAQNLTFQRDISNAGDA